MVLSFEIIEGQGTNVLVGRTTDVLAKDTLLALGSVAAVDDYAPPKTPSAPGRAVFDLLLESADISESLKLQINGLATVLEVSGRRARIEATTEHADRIRRLPGVLLLEPYVELELMNNRARALVWPQRQSPWPLDGAGELVAVVDSGIDETHPALASRLQEVIALGRIGDASDPSGHGTHVAGTIAATGPQAGIAPAAKLLFFSVMDSAGKLGGIPLDLAALIEPAYMRGARIHNNSWGARSASAYTIRSLEIDSYVHAHKDMLVVVAAGNSGTAVSPEFGPRRAKPGFVEWGSVNTPATSKNALVVGASRSDRNTGGLTGTTYGEFSSARFPDPPSSTDRFSGDPESIAAFSARGPSNDRRIKPDVVAPGTDVLSARAKTAPEWLFTGVEQLAEAAYGYMSGTSMATPVVAGCAALVRQWLRESRGCATPSAALLKALLITGTRKLTGASAIADHDALPNYHQGFGAIDLSSTLPFDETFRLAFEDNWQAPERQLSGTGADRRFRFTTTRRAPLRVTLAYTDYPGRGIQNDLSLFLAVPGEKRRVGNESVPNALFHPDPDNNVEVVRIDDAPIGSYLVQIAATTLLRPPQDFALVVSGALDADVLQAG